MNHSAKKGFTLIELMISVAIVGILAAIAYPSYTQFVAKGARADALAGSMHVANLQEQYYIDHRVFTNDMTKLGLNADPWKVENGFFEIDTTLTVGGYSIIATAIGVQATRDTACASITLSSTGAKTPAACW
ncbi:type IV pilin protein [Shewanella sp. ALD9]|jgi:type IV pilus assembly protein PilE|uniref:type IV pilin protein n=1 Tax=unclassified Shewanella TaxID=196818 RepID=UPI000C32D76D|nr:type IV pilin protein [Shewanella sp. ALD9]PKH31837.1 prepilin-type cleavage/methylation domain-containing protein [Shewanella sp. ALD9]